jgi:regulatory protein spx
MIKIYTFPSCSSSRQAKKWLVQEGIPYEECDMGGGPLTREELLHILSLTDRGLEDIISKRSRCYSKVEHEFESFSLDYVLSLIIKQPRILRSPLLVDGFRLQVGYNADDIRRFIPRKSRQLSLSLHIEQIVSRSEYLGKDKKVV